MPLINDVRKVVTRLSSDPAWKRVFAKTKLNITTQMTDAEVAAQLTTSLSTGELTALRQLSGFKDMAAEAKQLITPGKPARSILYHALASPNMTNDGQNNEMTQWPTQDELVSVENYVYASAKRSLDDVKRSATKLTGDNTPELGVVVFATEYRPAHKTPHRKHADICFSRTGVARVGTIDTGYDGKLRGYWPVDESQPHDFGIVPVKYDAYVAVKVRKSLANNKGFEFGPPPNIAAIADGSKQPDSSFEFWVPLHKLFNGSECLRGENLQCELNAQHVNEKIKRFHLMMKKIGVNAGHNNDDLTKAPFTITEDLATVKYSTDKASAWITPKPQPFVKVAEDEDGNKVSFIVPQERNTNASPNEPSVRIFGRDSQDRRILSSTLEMRTNNVKMNPVTNMPILDDDGDLIPVGDRPGPEYIHIREDDVLGDLNQVDSVDLANSRQLLKEGRRAMHFADTTADGWVSLKLSGSNALANLVHVNAYSLIGAPDFYPLVDQRDILEWRQANSNNPNILFFREPDALSEDRLPPNLTLPGAFDNDAEVENPVVTAIITQAEESRTGPIRRHIDSEFKISQNTLPDAAAGLYAPGWVVSFDVNEQKQGHLAAYGLGSPFPEDAKLCAALNGFWPAVAPDTTRTFAREELFINNQLASSTTVPMTDDEISSDLSWDGLQGPNIIPGGTVPQIEHPSFLYADYTKDTEKGKFSMVKTSKMTSAEYKRRILTMGAVRNYLAKHVRDLQLPSGGPNFVVGISIVNFSLEPSTHASVQDAQDRISGLNFSNEVYRFVFVRYNEPIPQNRGAGFDRPHHRLRARFSQQVELLIDGKNRDLICVKSINHGEGANLDWTRDPASAASPVPAL